MVARPPGAPPREIELKLLLDPAALDRVRSFGGFASRAAGPARRRRLHSTYYDTRDRALAGVGLALRVRHVEGSTLQTLKARSAEAAPFARLELEVEIESDEPRISAIPDPVLRDRVAGIAAGKPLEPVLETEVERTTRRLVEGRTRVDADLDVGEIRTPGGSVPICELELELVEGDAAALYALALELAEEVRVRLSDTSKFERGFALLSGAVAPPVKPRAPEIDRKQSLEAALETILRGAYEQILRNEDAAHDGEDVEGVHQMRVGVRRMRSALSLFSRVLPREPTGTFRKQLRELGRVLGGARDMDVFIRDVLSPIQTCLGDDGGALPALFDEAQRLRSERYEALRSALDSAEHARRMLELGGWIEGRGWRDQPLSPESAALFQEARLAAPALLDRRRRSVRRLSRAIESPVLDPARHALRVEIKKLRYAAESLGGAFKRKEVRRYARACAGAQDALGRLEDLMGVREHLATLAARVSQLDRGAVESAVGFVLGWTARDAESAAADVDRAWRRLRRARPFWR